MAWRCVRLDDAGRQQVERVRRALRRRRDRRCAAQNHLLADARVVAVRQRAHQRTLKTQLSTRSRSRSSSGALIWWDGRIYRLSGPVCSHNSNAASIHTGEIAYN